MQNLKKIENQQSKENQKLGRKKRKNQKIKKKKNKVRIHSPIIERIYKNFNNSKKFFYLNSKKKKIYF